MKMKFSPWLLAIGLAASVPAVAAEQADAAPQGSSMKVGIDAKTGKLRPLTAEESRALDLKTKASANAKSARTTNRAPKFPATAAESMATARTVGGITRIKPSVELLSSTMISRDASGNLTIQHVDSSQDAAAPVVAQTQELPSE